MLLLGTPCICSFGAGARRGSIPCIPCICSFGAGARRCSIPCIPCICVFRASADRGPILRIPCRSMPRSMPRISRNARSRARRTFPMLPDMSHRDNGLGLGSLGTRGWGHILAARRGTGPGHDADRCAPSSMQHSESELTRPQDRAPVRAHRYIARSTNSGAWDQPMSPSRNDTTIGWRHSALEPRRIRHTMFGEISSRLLRAHPSRARATLDIHRCRRPT